MAENLDSAGQAMTEIESDCLQVPSLNIRAEGFLQHAKKAFSDDTDNVTIVGRPDTCMQCV
jgi:hypothetical protein